MSESPKRLSAHNPPREYDLTNPAEVQRLLRETREYLNTCRTEHHGTDWEGRRFAIEGLDRLREVIK